MPGLRARGGFTGPTLPEVSFGECTDPNEFSQFPECNDDLGSRAEEGRACADDGTCDLVRTRGSRHGDLESGPHALNSSAGRSALPGRGGRCLPDPAGTVTSGRP